MYITEDMSKEEKNNELFNSQMETLKMFRDRGAISQEQFEKSSKDLKEKMGFIIREDSNSGIKK